MKGREFRQERTAAILVLMAVLWLLVPGASAHSKKGAQLVVRKADGTTIRAELLAVKERKLILLEDRTLADTSVDISDIRSIRIKKGNKMLPWTGIGALVGGGVGTIAFYRSEYQGAGIFFFAVIGAGVGLSFGTVESLDENCDLRGAPSNELHKVLARLNSLARFPAKEVVVNREP